MNHLKILLLILLVSSCSARYHLDKAIEKNPSLFDTTYTDTTLNFEFNFKDTVKIEGDTVEIDMDCPGLEEGIVYEDEERRLDYIPREGIKLVEYNRDVPIQVSFKDTVGMKFPTAVNVERERSNMNIFFYISGIVFWTLFVVSGILLIVLRIS